MISGITNFLTSSTLSNIAQSTTAAVSIETGMKAVGRPSFILVDKKLDSNTKKYAATKEFLYQATCLATYMAIIIPIFKKGAYKLAKNKILKNEAGFNLFRNANEYLDYKKLASLSKESRTEALKNKKYDDLFIKEVKEELKQKVEEKYYCQLCDIATLITENLHGEKVIECIVGEPHITKADKNGGDTH